MTKHILVVVSLLLVVNGFAGNTTKNKKSSSADSRLVTGQVIDKSTGELIAGAEVIIDNTVVYTDLNGMFAVKAAVNKDIVISSISYNQTKVSVATFPYNTLTIELNSQ